MTEVTAEIIKPFGPSIFKVKIPKQIVDDLNQYVDNTIEDKTKADRAVSILSIVGVAIIPVIIGTIYNINAVSRLEHLHRCWSCIA